MHVPLHGGVHFDAVVPKMAKQDFAFPASLRTTFLNWKVKPLDVAYERHRHKPAYCKCSYCTTEKHGCCECPKTTCPAGAPDCNTGPVNPCPNFLGVDENLCEDVDGNLKNATQKSAYIYTPQKGDNHGTLCNNQSIYLDRTTGEHNIKNYNTFVNQYTTAPFSIQIGACPP
jgi:hypothetical protein